LADKANSVIAAGFSRSELQQMEVAGVGMGCGEGPLGRSPDPTELKTSHTANVGIATEHHSLRAQLQAAGVRLQRRQ
jgi:hypothetical protein